ncbi:porin family protein [Salibacter halophilus]|uniref:Porin family protein n=1 Tax=Salibacter halophilus TaxID=1803916 RepID=A0A6N6MCE0_9FLAO|nr:porin family protein [Salibacter halophilus]KAB1065068.1 porin family protein [Salibacter halophilus]
MKRLTLFLFVVCSSISYAQNSFDKGSSFVDLGVGISTWGIPVYGGFETAVANNFTLGGRLSWRSWNEDIRGNGFNHNIFGIVSRGNYHVNEVLELPSNFDIYAGLNLGLYIYDSPSSYPGDSSSGLGLGAQVGGRYYFDESWAVNLEIGGGNAASGGSFGVTKNF